MFSLRLHHILASLCRAPHSQLAPHTMFPTVLLLPDPHYKSPDPSHQQFMLANEELSEEVVQAKEKLTLLGMMRETSSLFAEEPTANTRGQATVVFIYSEPYFITRSLDLQVRLSEIFKMKPLG